MKMIYLCLVDKQIAFAVIFSIARMVGGPYLSFKTLTSDNPFIIKVLAKIRISTIMVALAPNTSLVMFMDLSGLGLKY